MRQVLGPKKLARLHTLTGLPIVKVMVRGGTNHRQDLCLADGSIVCRWPDGTLEPSDGRWKLPEPPTR